MPDSRLTIRLTTELKRSLDRLARATGRSSAFLVQDALRQYLDGQGWQVAEIKKAVREADAEDFATDTEVDAALTKWGVNAS